MKLTLLVAVSLMGAAPNARAQTAPPAPTAPASGLTLIDLLHALNGRQPRDAEARLKALADQGDAAAKELLTALEHSDARAGVEFKMAPFDKDGAAVSDFRALTAALDAAHRGDRAAAILTGGDDKRGPLPPAPGEEDKEGWEHRIEAFAGGTAANGDHGMRVPATGVAYEGEYNRGPWKAELGARGLFSPTGFLAPSDGTLEATGLRKLGDSRFSLFAGAELHRDDLMGLAQHFSLHSGVQASVIDTKRQQLDVAFGVGRATEQHIGGDSEKHPLTLTSVDYSLRLSARAVFQQAFELESNPKSGKDYEFKSVTAFVYDVSKNFALKLSRQFVQRGDPVPGFASDRTETTVGLVIH
jgi:hypothetical protein